MASLFIKDGQTADQVRAMAQQLRTTQTDVVRRGVQALKREVAEKQASDRAATFTERLDAWRRDNPLPPPTGRVADKAFFDRLWGEPD